MNLKNDKVISKLKISIIIFCVVYALTMLFCIYEEIEYAKINDYASMNLLKNILDCFFDESIYGIAAGGFAIVLYFYNSFLGSLIEKTNIHKILIFVLFLIYAIVFFVLCQIIEICSSGLDSLGYFIMLIFAYIALFASHVISLIISLIKNNKEKLINKIKSFIQEI